MLSAVLACCDHNAPPSYHLDVFKSMFSKAESKEVDEASLTIDCKPDILSSFLHFLYKDQLEEEKGSYQGAIIVCPPKGYKCHGQTQRERESMTWLTCHGSKPRSTLLRFGGFPK